MSFKIGDLLVFDGCGCFEAKEGATAICKGFKTSEWGDEFIIVEWIRNELSGEQQDGGYEEMQFKKVDE